MKLVLKIIAALVVVCVVAAVAVGVFAVSHRGEIAENIVTEATGNAQAGALAGKVLGGEDLTDEEIEGALGLDDATYAAVKEAAAGAGVDINDSEQLSALAQANADKVDEVKGIVDKVKSGEMSQDEARALLEETITIPGD